MTFFRPINLPLSIIIPNGTLLGLSLYVTIFQSLPTITIKSTKDRDKRRPLEFFIPRATTRRINDTNVLFALATSCLMLPYVFSSYMPMEENQFLHASVPIRLMASAILFGHLFWRGRNGMSEEGYWEFLGMGMLDAYAAISIGIQLGSFDGVVASLRA